MKNQEKELQPKLLPTSTLGPAGNYFLNEYDALPRNRQDGRFEIDNKLVENDIRPTAVGRKRWLFIGHLQAGWRSAVIYSVRICCRRRDLNPHEYLTDVLARLPSTMITQIRALLPGNRNPNRTPAREASLRTPIGRCIWKGGEMTMRKAYLPANRASTWLFFFYYSKIHGMRAIGDGKCSSIFALTVHQTTLTLGLTEPVRAFVR